MQPEMAKTFCEPVIPCCLVCSTVAPNSVSDACNLSEKNDLVFLDSSSGIDTLLRVFASGTHRFVAQRLWYIGHQLIHTFSALIRDSSGQITGSISDRRLVSWLAEHVCTGFHTPVAISHWVLSLFFGRRHNIHT
jgi:hypothetical protein